MCQYLCHIKPIDFFNRSHDNFLLSIQNHIFDSMSKQRTYCFLCLFSLLLVFTDSFTFLGGFIFDTLTEKVVDQSDLLENETENENETKDPNPVEEEEEDPAQINIHTLYGKKYKSLAYHYRYFIWNNHNPVIPKEPPKKAV